MIMLSATDERNIVCGYVQLWVGHLCDMAMDTLSGSAHVEVINTIYTEIFSLFGFPAALYVCYTSIGYCQENYGCMIDSTIVAIA